MSSSQAMRAFRRPLVIVGIAVVSAAVVGMVFSGGELETGAATSTEQVSTVSRGMMNETVSAEGTIEAGETDDLSFGAAGTVTAVNVKAGDTVTAGQVLATIDSAELEAAVASADADLADAEAALDDDESSGASDEQIAASRASVTTAQDALASAQEDLAGASLIATFDGTVASVNVTLGEVLSSGGNGGTSTSGSGGGSGDPSATLDTGNTGGPPGRRHGYGLDE